MSEEKNTPEPENKLSFVLKLKEKISLASLFKKSLRSFLSKIFREEKINEELPFLKEETTKELLNKKEKISSLLPELELFPNLKNELLNSKENLRLPPELEKKIEKEPETLLSLSLASLETVSALLENGSEFEKNLLLSPLFDFKKISEKIEKEKGRFAELRELINSLNDPPTPPLENLENLEKNKIAPNRPFGFLSFLKLLSLLLLLFRSEIGKLVLFLLFRLLLLIIYLEEN